MGKECADCGNERIMLCPFCEHDFSEQSKKNDAELHQLRREVERLRSVAEAAKKIGTGSEAVDGFSGVADEAWVARTGNGEWTLRRSDLAALRARLAELEKQ